MSSHLDVHHGEAGQHAGLHGLDDAGLHGGDVLLGDGPADDLVLEGEAGAVLVGLHLDDHVAVLAAAAGLADEAALGLGHRLGDALAVGHLRPAHVGVDLELAQQPVDDDLQVQLAHAGDDGLARSPRRCAPGRSGPPRPAS